MFHKEAFIEFLQFEKRTSEHTVTAYQNDINQFIQFLDETYEVDSIQDVNHQLVRSWLIHLLDDQSLSTSSVNRKLSALKTYFKFLRKNQIIDNNPLQKIIAPKKSKRLPEFVEQKSMDKLFDEVAFPNDFVGKRDELILEMLYLTGMRLSELIGVKLDNIDSQQGFIKVLGKRNKERFIPVSGAFINKIEKYLAERQNLEQLVDPDYLFLTEKGKKIYSSLVYNIVKTNLNLVTTIKKKSPHVIRHTFATHMLNNGADLNTIKEILGHANLAATQVYTHNSFERIKSIYKQAHPRA